MRNQSRFSIVLGAALALAGCQAEVSVQPPSEVISAFKRDHPDARDTKVEKETNRNGDTRYEYKYTDANGKKHVFLAAAGENGFILELDRFLVELRLPG